MYSGGNKWGLGVMRSNKFKGCDIFGGFSSFLEGLLVDVVIVLGGRVEVPDGGLVGEVGVVEVSVAGLAVPDGPARVVPEGVVLEFLVRPDEGTPVDWGVLPGVVDEHGGVEVGPDSLLEVLEGLSELGGAFGEVVEELEFFPGDADVAMVVGGVAPVFADGPLLFPAEEAAGWGEGYR